MKQELIRNPDFWKNEVSFYVDRVSFVHKYNLKSGAASNRARVWGKRGEGLQLTTKGCKDFAGGRCLHVIVAIAYQKKVILKVPCKKKIGEFFATFIQEHFNLTFAKAGPKAHGRRYLLWTTTPHRPVRLRNSPLKILREAFMKSHPGHQI